MGKVLSNGIAVPSFFDFIDFTLAANTTYGIYVKAVNEMLNYSDGINTYSNSDISLTLGIGRQYKSTSDFTGENFAPRTWNGTIYYDITSVPEPSTLAIFALGLMGLASRRFKKHS
ncbi:MAG: hypothetical protein ACI88A_003398 [Paraglaciecola sp.]|jgi:hypothetical protein